MNVVGISDRDVVGATGETLFIKWLSIECLSRGLRVSARVSTDPFDGLQDVIALEGDREYRFQIKTKKSGATERRKDVACARTGLVITCPRDEYGLESWRWDRYIRRQIPLVFVDIHGPEPLLWGCDPLGCAPRYGCRADCDTHPGWRSTCDRFVFVDRRLLLPLNDAAIRVYGQVRTGQEFETWFRSL